MILLFGDGWMEARFSPDGKSNRVRYTEQDFIDRIKQYKWHTYQIADRRYGTERSFKLERRFWEIDRDLKNSLKPENLNKVYEPVKQ